MPDEREHTVKITNASNANLDNALRNAILFASKDTMLPALCAVQFAVRGGELVLTATDRYVLAFAHVERREDETEVHAPGSFLLSVADAKDLLAALKRTRGANRSGVHVVDIEHDTDAGRVTFRMEWGQTERSYRTVEGNYPSVLGLFPANADKGHESEWGLTPEIAKVLGSLKDHRVTPSFQPHLRFSPAPEPAKPLPFKLGDWLRGLVMPVRLSDSDDELKPAWLTGVDAAAKAVSEAA